MESLSPPLQPRRFRVLHAAASFLGEGMMGFLALVALAISCASLLFSLPAPAQKTLSVLEWAIIGVFALEYLVHLALASDREAFARDPWRMLDLAIIVIPLLSLLPILRPLRSSPVLRLIRLSRVVLLGARFGGRASRRPLEGDGDAAGSAEVWILRDRATSPERADPDQALRRVSHAAGEWIEWSRPTPEVVGEIARAAHLPEPFLRTGLGGTTRPRLEVFDHFSALFLWKPEGVRAQAARISLLLITTNRVLLGFCPDGGDLLRRTAAALPKLRLPEEAPFPTRMTYAVLRVLLERYHEVTGRLDGEVRQLEEVPAREGGPRFFADAFTLERELTAIRGDLWRLKGVTASLSEGRVHVQGARKEDRELLRSIAEEAESLHETVSTLRESLVSLMDLHMNVASFEMNRGMRLLAVLSALGLIPAVVGGLLGMNLIGNPWPATLPQVAYGVFWGMALAVYVFFIKGWIR
jgi:Mg2+ and Co2+ transporter CorA